MKLLEMKRVKGDGAYDDECDWFVQFESYYEEQLYKDAERYYHKVPEDNPNNEYFCGYGAGIIKGMLSIGLGDRYTDDDIYYYFMKGEKVPEVGEHYTIDDIEWERIK